MKAIYIALVALTAGFLTVARAQNSNSTLGACSPIVTNNQASVTIECKGMSEQLQRQLVDILNSILQKQLDPKLVMDKLNEIGKGVGELKRKSVDAERGIISIYDFNGVQRIQSAGRIDAIAGDQVVAFNQIVELAKARRWQELADLCEQQIIAAPKWLTAYLCAGEAYANLGDRAKAIERLEHVVRNAGSDPAYKQAGAMLTSLKASQ